MSTVLLETFLENHPGWEEVDAENQAEWEALLEEVSLLLYHFIIVEASEHFFDDECSRLLVRINWVEKRNPHLAVNCQHLATEILLEKILVVLQRRLDAATAPPPNDDQNQYRDWTPQDYTLESAYK